MVFKIFLSLLSLLIMYLFHRFIMKPYLAIKYYKKQGFKMSFFYPFTGVSKLFEIGVKQFNDVHYHRRHHLEAFPGSKGIVTNVMDSACLIIADPAIRKDYFVYKQPNYVKHPLLKNFRMDDSISPKPTLILAEGEEWKRIRRLISKTFHHDFIMSNLPLMNSIADEVFGKIKDLENVNLMDEFQTIAGNVILSSMLGEDFLGMKYKGMTAPVAMANISSQVFEKRYRSIFMLLGKKISKAIFPSFAKDVKDQEDFFKNFVFKYVQDKFEEHKAKIKENPNLPEKFLIDSLFNLLIKDEDHLTLEEIFSNINLLFIAGTDTTGHLLAHLIYSLWKNPGVYDKLMKELEEHKSAIEKHDFDTIKNLDYFNGVIKEGLRLVSPANDVFLRVAIKDHKLGDFFVKKGTSLFLGLAIGYHDPKVFRDPFVFRPERWIKSDLMFDNAEEKDPYCYLPFSAGAKNCIGQHMAIVEAKIILSKFLMKFKFEIKIKEPLTWVIRTVTEPKEPLMARLTERVKTMEI